MKHATIEHDKRLNTFTGTGAAAGVKYTNNGSEVRAMLIHSGYRLIHTHVTLEASVELWASF